MEESFSFDLPGRVGFHHAREDFFRGWHQALGPAGLLGFEAVHIDGYFGSGFDLREIEKLPAFELRAVGKIGVFRKGAVLPTAGFFDGLAAPNTCGAVEIEKSAAAGTRTVLDDEVAVEQDGFHLSEERIIAVEVSPARLHHTDLGAAAGIDEIWNGAAEEIRFGDKVGVKDGDEFALRSLEAVFQGAGLVTFAIAAVNVHDTHAFAHLAFH